MARSRRRPGIVLAAALFVTALAGRAHALDCPPGATPKSEDGFDWCEPSVCENDSQCTPNVCRPVPLCVQVGSTSDAATGKRLVATQRCAPDKSCPQTTVCSDMGRCVSKADAERMGMVAPAASAPVTVSEPKSKCGCDVVGLTAPPRAGLVAIAAAIVLSVRRARAGTRASRPRAR